MRTRPRKRIRELPHPTTLKESLNLQTNQPEFFLTVRIKGAEPHRGCPATLLRHFERGQLR